MTVAAWDLGNTIRSSRIKKGYTQEALSELLDITPSHLKQMEGGRRNPSVPLLFQMMELLDFSVDALVFPERESAPAIHTDGLRGCAGRRCAFLRNWGSMERPVRKKRPTGQGGETTRKNRYALGGHRPPRAYQNRGKVSSAPGPWSPPRP